MNKKELRNIIPEFQIEKHFEKETDYYIDEIKKDKVSCWGIYKKIKGTQYRLLLIHFFDDKTWITYANNKWLNGKLDNLKEFSRIYFGRCQFDMQDKYNKLIIWEEERKKEENQIYYNKKMAEFKEANKKVHQDIPANFKKYIRNKVMPGYALYQNKEHKATCTTCNKTFQTKGLKRNQVIICPHCKKTLKSLPNGKYKILDQKYACLIQKVENEKVVLRYFLASHYKNKDIDNYRAYEVRRDFINLNTGEVEPYIWEQFKGSQICTFIPEKYYKKCSSYYCVKDYWIGKSYIWTGNLYNIPKLKYIFKNMNYESLNKIYKDVSYSIAYMIRYPFLETWIKSGKDIRIITKNLKTIKPNISEASKAIGIPRDIIRNIPNNSNETIINNIRYLIKEKTNITNEIIKYLASNTTNLENYIEDWKKNSNFKLQKVINYIANNNVCFPDYRDYFDKLMQLNQELDKNLLYPKNFKQVHDEILLENKYRNERIKEERYQEIKRTSNFKKIKLGNLIIRMPESIREIVAEGLQQSNCVSTYVDKIINKQTTVLFARKINQPDVPYITIEVRKNVVSQARYSHNINCEKQIYEKIYKYLEIVNKKADKAA